MSWVYFGLCLNFVGDLLGCVLESERLYVGLLLVLIVRYELLMASIVVGYV